jgi:hypothetical protein
MNSLACSSSSSIGIVVMEVMSVVAFVVVGSIVA